MGRWEEGGIGEGEEREEGGGKSLLVPRDISPKGCLNSSEHYHVSI